MAHHSYVSVFSPEGRLYQVEYSLKCLAHEKLTNLALKGKDCLVVICQKKVPDKLMKVDSITHAFWVTKTIGLVMCGRVPDCAQIVEEARYEALDFFEAHGYECDTTWLAKRLGEKAQVYTQQAGLRPLGSGAIVFGMEENAEYDLVPKIYTVDPSGLVIGYQAVAQGEKQNEVNQQLEKVYKADQGLDETIMNAIQALQKSLGANENSITAADMELVVVTKDQPGCRFLPNEKVEEYITRVVERD
eukprot:TRINITY_DN3423_c2_g1_i1.p1 TRINITY_DN3423_c2_g1~~TRINITY_DN3423_c2_g1_i1.p1  ORF type:complete len:246 (+),score=111.69 TRINITY_DN3423_c2_g1_i1:123-860(+)